MGLAAQLPCVKLPFQCAGFTGSPAEAWPSADFVTLSAVRG